MPAYCPVCKLYMYDNGSLCPHVAALADRDADTSWLMIDGEVVGSCDCESLQAEQCLTLLGTIEDDIMVLFSPSPRVYFDALCVALRNGLPVSELYSESWYIIGMEDHDWHQ